MKKVADQSSQRWTQGRAQGHQGELIVCMIGPPNRYHGDGIACQLNRCRLALQPPRGGKQGFFR